MQFVLCVNPHDEFSKIFESKAPLFESWLRKVHKNAIVTPARRQEVDQVELVRAPTPFSGRNNKTYTGPWNQERMVQWARQFPPIPSSSNEKESEDVSQDRKEKAKRILRSIIRIGGLKTFEDLKRCTYFYLGSAGHTYFNLLTDAFGEERIRSMYNELYEGIDQEQGEQGDTGPTGIQESKDPCGDVAPELNHLLGGMGSQNMSFLGPILNALLFYTN